jgi:hypothetical protein
MTGRSVLDFEHVSSNHVGLHDDASLEAVARKTRFTA